MAALASSIVKSTPTVLPLISFFYHAADTLELCEFVGLRTYIPEPQHKHERRWTDKPAEFQRAVYNNRRRNRRSKGKQLQRRRSELCERSFAHICDTGGGRRSWLRSLVNVTKRYLIAAAATIWAEFCVSCSASANQRACKVNPALPYLCSSSRRGS